jgi:folate-binding protein YgfZ
MMNSDFFVKLPNRGAVIIGGEDRKIFLQGLITNDVNLLESQPCLYSWMLTPQGRFMHDFFISEQNDTLLLECEDGERAQDFWANLKKFKLRSKITLDWLETIDVFAGSGTGPADALPDPRHAALGWRGPTAPTHIPDAPFDLWDRHRLTLGIPDGSRDLTPERAMPMESGLDRLNGLSFTKGCFMGQELTARMHYRDLTKKHLITIQTLDPANTLPVSGTALQAGDKVIGEMHSSCGNLGMALIRDEGLDLLEQTGLTTAAAP